MRRKAIPQDTLTEVLASCRRRCCICWGLERDHERKKGQIAHLDGDATNNDIDNLAYLCLPHHDEFDSSTSQSKGLTVTEVKEFRRELHEIIDEAWKKPVSFGDTEVVPVPRDDEISGHYVREDEFEEAEFDVTLLPNNRVRVEGFALWGTTRPGGPNLGDLAFESLLEDGSTVYREGHPSREDYTLKLDFGEGEIRASESGRSDHCGMNVRFEGEYERIGPPSSSST